MADKRISDLTLRSGDDLRAADLLPIEDTSASDNFGVRVDKVRQGRTNFATISSVLSYGGFYDGLEVAASGYASSGDSGGGSLYFDDTDTSVPNGGTFFLPDNNKATDSNVTIGTGDGSQTSFATNNSPVVPSGVNGATTVEVTATIGGSSETFTFDGTKPTGTETASSGGHDLDLTYSSGALAFSTAPDSGTDVTATYDYASSSGRLRRSFDRPPTLDAFGAAGDGAADDSAALARALDAFDVVALSPEKTYLLSEVEISGQALVSRGGQATITKPTDGSADYALSISGNGTIVQGLKFGAGSDGGGQPEGEIKILEGAENIVINGNIFEGSTYGAIIAQDDTAATGSSDWDTRAKGIIISDNQFIGSYTRPLFLHGLQHLIIASNYFTGCDYDAIRLRENDGYCLIMGNQGREIGDQSWPDAQTRDFVDTAWSGENLSIIGNHVEFVAHTGLDIKGTDHEDKYRSRRMIVIGNVIRHTRFSGITFFGDYDRPTTGDYQYVYNIIVSGNIVEHCAQDRKPGGWDDHHGENNEADIGAGVGGIVCKRYAKYVSIVDNHCSYTYGPGISVMPSGTTYALNKHVTVRGNYSVNNGSSYNNGLDTPDPEIAGIFIRSCDGLLYADNWTVNDSDLPNPEQNIGLTYSGTGEGDVTQGRRAMLRDSFHIDNLQEQVRILGVGERFDSILSYQNMYEEGPEAYQYVRTNQQQLTLHGQVEPASSDGTFRQGDIVWHSDPSADDPVGWICTAGGNPGTWAPFGSVGVEVLKGTAQDDYLNWSETNQRWQPDNAVKDVTVVVDIRDNGGTIEYRTRDLTVMEQTAISDWIST